MKGLARLRERYRVRPGYWFAPKMFGLGAVPVTWQGWAATLVFVALAVVIAMLAEHRSDIWIILLIPLILGFIGLSRAKTDGGWRWRWGYGENEK
ncbi:hypothetical protein [Sphingomonas soli]|uniref:hypothetical protein n=1 Tax=Sphingomonas soli TaxID=266127 RepID=UPI0008363898|nr:hypothetical protein [Sphingomonas soli]